jgi:uncharacterized protein YbgA (DUF1722 family)
MNKEVTLEDVRSFTKEQFERIKKSNEIKKLVHFHTINKYLFMAQNQSGLKTLGKLVANKDKKPINIIFQEYEYTLNQILICEATIPSISNVLNKIYSHFKKKFTLEENLGEILNHVDNYIHKYENGYLQRQTFYLLYSDIEYDNFSLN